MKQTKKIIGLSDELIEKVNEYSDKYNLGSFAAAVRQMIENADMNKAENEEVEKNVLEELTEKVNWLMKNYKYFQADETLSTIGNMDLALKETQTKLEEVDKKVNILTSVSKMFKGHIQNRDLHMQD